ncbi:MAG: hypothetical protein JW940_33045 [Polyangiaceae bacterium]|nr:hypothetical protein [Polyangiaceae bacterium]
MTQRIRTNSSIYLAAAFAWTLLGPSGAWANQGTVIGHWGDWCESAEPQSNEAILYFGDSFTGGCQVVYYDSSGRSVPPHSDQPILNFDAWTCFDNPYSHLANDTIRSIKVGSETRLWAFKHSFNNQENSQPLRLGPGARLTTLGAFASAISAVRVVDAVMYNDTCTQNVFGSIVLYSDADQQGDCVILTPPTVAHTYPTPRSMCFHNDTASSYHNYAMREAHFYEHADYGGRHIPAATPWGNFSTFFVHNDVISSFAGFW